MLKKKTVMLAFGTRPEAIKMAPLILAMQKDAAFSVVTCVTAQHREMLDQVLEFFGIVPDYDLDLMKPGQSLEELTARILTSMSGILAEMKPDLLIVQGDTTTVMISALGAFYKGIAVGHLEAGLRTGNKLSPFPEELNRVLTSHIAKFHFAPTRQAIDNLVKENIIHKVYMVGNTVIDALFAGLEIIKNSDVNEYNNQFDYLDLDRKIVLITGHRRESFGEPFKNICQAIEKLATDFPDIQFVYPVHLNPNVHHVVHDILQGLPNVFLVEPLPYPSLIWLMSKSHFVMTDSGGIQEEAPSLGKPVLVMREQTERQEGVDAGTARLVGTDRDRIYTEAFTLLTDEAAHTAMANAVNPYGDGSTSNQIIEILKKELT